MAIYPRCGPPRDVNNISYKRPIKTLKGSTNGKSEALAKKVFKNQSLNANSSSSLQRTLLEEKAISPVKSKDLVSEGEISFAEDFKWFLSSGSAAKLDSILNLRKTVQHFCDVSELSDSRGQEEKI